MDLRVIIFQEGESWSAQCIDYDIGTRGESLKEVQQRMKNQLIVEAMFSYEATGEIFGGIPAAPSQFHDKWEDCADGLFTGTSNFPAMEKPVQVNMQLCA